jgi:hypothetical protein
MPATGRRDDLDDRELRTRCINQYKPPSIINKIMILSICIASLLPDPVALLQSKTQSADRTIIQLSTWFQRD